jgi:hypothetical protein
MVQSFIFTVIGLEETKLYLTLALPFLAAFFTSLGIIMEIKKEVED